MVGTTPETAETLDSGPCGKCGRHNPVDARFCGGCGARVALAEGERPADVADPLVGQIIADRYHIQGLLGRGGMGVVYRVQHVHIGKLMAMKLLHGELARDRNTVKRFQREAEAASRLSHPNTVQVFDFGRSEGLMYLVMEYLEGVDLGELIRREKQLEFARAARIAAQVCASVAEAHAQGIVHRDIKPENVFILDGTHEVAKVLDFGLAKLRDQRGNVTVTRAGHIVGTPYYMPPEQIRGETVDARGDVYAIGAMLYKACTGSPPFVANTPMGVLTKHLTEPLEMPSSRSGSYLPPAADAIIARAMQKDKGDRFPSAESMREALAAFLAEVGQELSNPALRSQVVTELRPKEAFATRRDVDGYERRLRRRGVFAYAIGALLLGGLGVGGWVAYQRMSEVEAIPSAEREPNNEPERANTLPPDVEITAYLGKRSSEALSDIDLFAIENATGERKLLQVDVSALPNMDLVIDVVPKGRPSPVLSVDSGAVGVAERIPNFPLPPGEYYLRVHERWITGAFPTENVSDPYRIRWTLSAWREGWEEEINDRIELAGELRVGAAKRGYIGWGGDVDFFCLAEDLPAVRVQVTGVEGLDLSLTSLDRVRASETRTDQAAVGEGESVVVAPAFGRRTCFALRADEERPLRAQAQIPYTLTAEAASPPAGEAAP